MPRDEQFHETRVNQHIERINIPRNVLTQSSIAANSLNTKYRRILSVSVQECRAKERNSITKSSTLHRVATLAPGASAAIPSATDIPQLIGKRDLDRSDVIYAWRCVPIENVSIAHFSSSNFSARITCQERRRDLKCRNTKRQIG